VCLWMASGVAEQELGTNGTLVDLDGLVRFL
jgi:hypothetical protein